jgi:hypothetical protein
MTAIPHIGTLRYRRRNFRRSSKSGWKSAMLGYGIIAIGAFFALNWIYQVVRKPGEIFAPISASLAKSPDSTWQSYRSLFEKHSTKIISPEFLAALAQVEGSGNPIASTYWRWRWSWNPLEIYRPASSAVGMFQITDGTFAEARKYCIRDHQVVTEGPWHDVRSCWFNRFYSRTLPSHSTELTAAYLHRNVVHTLAARPNIRSTLPQQQKLAAVIHLCGLRRGETFVSRGFKVIPGERCGTHNLAGYLKKVELLKTQFARLRARTVV